MRTIVSLLNEYREYLEHERQLAAQTVKAYLSDLRVLNDFVSEKPIDEIGLDDLRAFIRDMSKHGLKTGTIHRRVGGFTTFWKWLRLQHFQVEVITEGLKLPKLQQKIPAYLTASEVKLFANTPSRGATPFIRKRNEMAFKTLAWFGLRRSELLNLKVSDVHLADKLLVVRNTKSKRDRMLPIPSGLVGEFEQWISKLKPDSYLFPSSNGKVWRQHFFYAAFYKHVADCGLSGRDI